MQIRNQHHAQAVAPAAVLIGLHSVMLHRQLGCVVNSHQAGQDDAEPYRAAEDQLGVSLPRGEPFRSVKPLGKPRQHLDDDVSRKQIDEYAVKPEGHAQNQLSGRPLRQNMRQRHPHREDGIHARRQQRNQLRHALGQIAMQKDGCARGYVGVGRQIARQHEKRTDSH